jgi:hypothetical protein
MIQTVAELGISQDIFRSLQLFKIRIIKEIT